MPLPPQLAIEIRNTAWRYRATPYNPFCLFLFFCLYCFTTSRNFLLATTGHLLTLTTAIVPFYFFCAVNSQWCCTATRQRACR